MSKNNDFFTNGFVLIKNAIDKNILGDCQKEILQLVKLARKGGLKYVKIFNDYPNFFNRYNIGQIDAPFEEEGRNLINLKKSVESINFDKLYNEYLGGKYDNYFSYELRFHVTNPEYKHSSVWHRDCLPGNDLKFNNYETAFDDLRINFFYFDEGGFRVVPKSNSFFNEDKSNDKIVWKYPSYNTFFRLKDEINIKANAGDILIFHPDLLHRAHCSSFRAHLHIASATKDYIINKGMKHNFEKIKYDDFFPKNLKYDNQYKIEKSLIPFNKNKNSEFKKWIRLMNYYSPFPSVAWFKSILYKNSHIDNSAFYHRPSYWQED